MLHNADGHSNIDAPNPLMSNKPTPLPKLQVFIVLLVQFSDPLAGLVVYPFINQFVRETGITQGDERKTGYYAGIIVRCNRTHSPFNSAHFYSGIFILLRRRLYGCAMGLFIRPIRA